MDRTDQSIIIMSGKKLRSFNFAGPEDEKTFKTLRPLISNFLDEYATSKFDADKLADEIVKVLNSDEHLHSQVLTFVKQSESAELAIFEALNFLVSSENLESALQDDEQKSNEKSEEDPDKKSRRNRRAALPVKSELNHLSALEVEETNEAIGPDQERFNSLPGKRTLKILPGNQISLKSGSIPVQLDNQQNGRDEKPTIVQKKVPQNGDISGAKQQIPDPDGQKSENVDDNHNQPRANLKGNQNVDFNESVQKHADEPHPGGPNSRDNDSIDPNADTPSLNNKMMNQKDVRQGPDERKDVNNNLKELVKVDTRDDALQVGKPSFNKPQLSKEKEGAIQQVQNSAKEEVGQKSPEVGKANPPEISESHSRAHISDSTAKIIKEVTNSFIQAHKGESFRYTFSNGMASLNFTVSFTSSNEIGSYDLVFHNCPKDPLDASILMVERNGDNYLSLGEQPLAMLFCVFSIIYACLAMVWGFHLRFSKVPLFSLTFIFVLSLLGSL
ncbi:unnamed protein product [Rodentolepis nana]|uniref:CUE domain-containing protein n=1 Tax=Rodentolepis nana TaxID=102285 RepID=A0A158QII5_RODNA|nr:unnamed protein product [Rodentolepis nana]